LEGFAVTWRVICMDASNSLVLEDLLDLARITLF
jgi:hypothetical protein